MIQLRAEKAAPRVDAVMKSLRELLEYAGRFGIRLGLENRYHYGDIPHPDELEQLLTLAGPDRLGFIYDAGHGKALENLGFFDHSEWLKRFSARIIGVHLHDIRGITDHLAPGLGEIDYGEIAGVLPEDAFRTAEIRPDQTPMQVVAGMEILVEKGCVKCR
jgi:sugar phosphate isomerase/epimerase